MPALWERWDLGSAFRQINRAIDSGKTIRRVRVFDEWRPEIMREFKSDLAREGWNLEHAEFGWERVRDGVDYFYDIVISPLLLEKNSAAVSEPPPWAVKLALSILSIAIGLSLIICTIVLIRLYAQ